MQKTILRNGLIAALFAFIMVLCCMPQKASATDYSIYLDGTATLNGYIYTDIPTEFEGAWYSGGYWQGDATFYKTGDIIIQGPESYSKTISGDTVDFEAIIEDFKEQYPEYENNTLNFMVMVPVRNEDSSVTGTAEFEYISYLYIDAQAVVESPVSEDTTFEYDIDAVVLSEDYDSRETSVTRKKSRAAQFVDNTLTIKKGQSVSDALDQLILVIQGELSRWEEGYIGYGEDFYIIKEKDNKYGYARSNNEYGIIFCGMVNNMKPDQEHNQNDDFIIFGFDNFENGADGLVAGYENFYKYEYPEGNWDAYEELFNKITVLNKIDTNAAATFKHLVATSGVNTADSSDIALWIALFAIAVVAGGAVALKKN